MKQRWHHSRVNNSMYNFVCVSLWTWSSAVCAAPQSAPQSPGPCGAPPPSWRPDASPPLTSLPGSASSLGSGHHRWLGTERPGFADDTPQRTEVLMFMFVCQSLIHFWTIQICSCSTLLSSLISSSCSILKTVACSTNRCARSWASSSSSVSAGFTLRDMSASKIWRFLSSAAFWMRDIFMFLMF